MLAGLLGQAVVDGFCRCEQHIKIVARYSDSSDEEFSDDITSLIHQSGSRSQRVLLYLE